MQKFEDFLNAPCSTLGDGQTWRDYFIQVMMSFNAKMEMNQHQPWVQDLNNTLALMNPKIKGGTVVNWEEQEKTLKDILYYVFYLSGSRRPLPKTGRG
jgi:hypothetical protein